MSFREYNFDGLVGPTHNYSGLAYGNVASAEHRNQVSNPRAAALQGLEKMKTLFEMGIGQAILPPLHRPHISFLRKLGYSGSRGQIIDEASRDRVLLATMFSASNMWTANAATVSPAPDCADRRLHLTIANLTSGLHRYIEANGTHRVLRALFANDGHFCVHPPLPSATTLADEGAANHTRLCDNFNSPGLEIFVYGRSGFDSTLSAPKNYPARQTREASEAVARRHGLADERTVYAQQNPIAIDAGVFHNDVISVGHQNVLLVHEQAFVDQPCVINEINEKFSALANSPLFICELRQSEISLADCVSSYLFNSQILTRPDGNMTLVCPTECQENNSAAACVQRIIDEVAPIDEVRFLDLRQSMNNGGGPACLRLRVCLNDEQVAALHPTVLFTETLFERLARWVNNHYRETLTPADLTDPKLPIEVDAAFVELTDILQLPENTLLRPSNQ